jgi:hypothetical protein
VNNEKKSSSTTTTTAAAAATTTLVDITSLLEDAASTLTHGLPMLHTSSFNLQDSMATLEIMDRMMDCCEIPISEINQRQRSTTTTTTNNNNKDWMVFPRPALTGLDDAVDPLPWKELTIESSAFIAMENLVRLESLLSGSSVVESIYTNLYVHKVVLEDMGNRLLHPPSSVLEELPSKMGTGTISQHVVFATTLLLVEQTDLLRGVVLNADIYEEEDFAVGMYNIPTMEGRVEESVLKRMGRVVLEMIQQEVSRS